MVLVKQPRQVRTVPAGSKRHGDLEGGGDPADGFDAKTSKMSRLKAGDGGLMHSRPSGHVQLTQPAPAPDGAENRSDALIIHGGKSVGTRLAADLPT